MSFHWQAQRMQYLQLFPEVSLCSCHPLKEVFYNKNSSCQNLWYLLNYIQQNQYSIFNLLNPPHCKVVYFLMGSDFSSVSMRSISYQITPSVFLLSRFSSFSALCFLRRFFRDLSMVLPLLLSHLKTQIQLPLSQTKPFHLELSLSSQSTNLIQNPNQAIISPLSFYWLPFLACIKLGQ